MTFKERLQQLGFSRYEDYLRSDHWQDVRRRFWASKLHKRACYVCGAEGALQVHHKSYKRLGAEKLHDLCLLCDLCHKETHQLDRTRGKGCLWGAAKRRKLKAKAWRKYYRLVRRYKP